MVVLEPEHVTDVDLVVAAQEGSGAAFAELYARHHDRILRHCRARIGPGDAADATQETFLRAYRALDRFGADLRFGAWLRTIATNVCIDMLRRRSRSVPVAEVDVPPVEDADLATLTTHAQAMTDAMAKISDRHRAILQLREYEGWSYERIADHEALDLNAVKSLLWRARQSLRKELLLASAQGRFAMVLVAGHRLRGWVGQLGGATTTAGAATVAAAVAVPVFAIGPSAPVALPPPAAPATTTTTVVVPPPATTTTLVVRARSVGAPAVVEVAAPTTTTTTTAAPTTTTTAPAPVVAAEAERADDAAEAKEHRREERAVERAEREVERAERHQAREATKALELAERDEAREERREERVEAREERQAERVEERVERAEERAERAEERAERGEGGGPDQSR